jgi:hypothetical protein
MSINTENVLKRRATKVAISTFRWRKLTTSRWGSPTEENASLHWFGIWDLMPQFYTAGVAQKPSYQECEQRR